jgi:hypothetical protein
MSDEPRPVSRDNALRLFYARWLLRWVGWSLVAVGWPVAAWGMASLVADLQPWFGAVMLNGAPARTVREKTVVAAVGAGVVAVGAGLLWARRRLPPGISPFAKEALQAVRRPAPDADPAAGPDRRGV